MTTVVAQGKATRSWIKMKDVNRRIQSQILTSHRQMMMGHLWRNQEANVVSTMRYIML